MRTRTQRFGGVALAIAALLTMVGCAPHAAMVRHPLAVHLADRPEGEGARRVVQWCDAAGVCHIAPQAVLDERDVRSVGLDRGEGRLGLVLELNSSGRAKLAAIAQGSSSAGRLTLVVDERALEASQLEASRRSGQVRVQATDEEIERLFQRLTRTPAEALPR